MNDFTWQCPTRLVFGKDALSKTGQMIKEYHGTKVLMVTGSGSIKKNGVFDKVVSSLEENNISFVELSGVEPNPKLTLVRKGLEMVKQMGLDFILAVGGGSAIDTAKAIAGGAKLDQGVDVWDDIYMVQGKSFPCSMPHAAVLTLPASGSEMSNSSVITNAETGFKRGVNSQSNYPLFAIEDPQVCYSLPAYQTACGCVDIFSHLMERYFTLTEDVDLTDNLLEAVMKTVVTFAPRCLKDPTDYNNRAQIMYAGTLAHNNLFGVGRVQDWASHWLEHELSTQYNIAHGAGLAIMTPAWMRYVYKAKPSRFVRFFVNVMGVGISITEEEKLIQEGIEKLTLFFKSLGLPTCLSDIGVKDDRDFALMAKRALSGGRKHAGNFMPLYEQDLINIYNLAL